MAKVTRRLLARGKVYDVECAVRSDGATSPASEFLDALHKGMWTDDTDAEGFPDVTQIQHHHRLIAWIQRLADFGVPDRRSAVNALNDGVWEFKPGGIKRLSFYDTPGDGTYTAKSWGDGPGDGSEFWWFPEFDDYIRLGHAFAKDDQKTRDGDIEITLLVREEDLRHDEEPV